MKGRRTRFLSTCPGCTGDAAPRQTPVKERCSLTLPSALPFLGMGVEVGGWGSGESSRKGSNRLEIWWTWDKTLLISHCPRRKSCLGRDSHQSPSLPLPLGLRAARGGCAASAASLHGLQRFTTRTRSWDSAAYAGSSERKIKESKVFWLHAGGRSACVGSHEISNTRNRSFLIKQENVPRLSPQQIPGPPIPKDTPRRLVLPCSCVNTAFLPP